MQREIKFRAWDGKQMLSWACVRQEHLNGLEDDRWQWMQFTGLRDANGVEIYEGDVVRINNKYRRFPDDELQDLFITTEISFSNGAFWFRGGGYTNCNWHHYPVEDRTVIGNVFENPELLEAK